MRRRERHKSCCQRQAQAKASGYDSLKAGGYSTQVDLVWASYCIECSLPVLTIGCDRSNVGRNGSGTEHKESYARCHYHCPRCV